MNLSRFRLAAVVEVEQTADAARLGSWLALFSSVVVALTGGYVDPLGADHLLTWMPITVGGFLLLAGATRWVPWPRLGRRATLAFPLAAFALLGLTGVLAHEAAMTYVNLFTAWFMFIGLTARPRTGWLLVPAASVAWLLVMGELDPQRVVRLVLAALVWGLLAEVIARRAQTSTNRAHDLLQQAETDPLTGLPNRRALDLSLGALRTGDVVCVVDLDHFKQINDRGGHQYGDRVLIDFAQVLTTVVRGTDLVCRFGGEEFVLVLPSNNRSGLGAASVLARLRGRWSELHPDITWSAGAACHLLGQEPHETLREADRALYEAKRTGRDRVVAAGDAAQLAGVGQVPVGQSA